LTTAPHQDAGPPTHWREFPPLELHPMLLHAMEAFNEHGYHGTSVRDIARRAHDPVTAERELRTALAIWPDEPYCNMNLGRLLLELA